MRLGWSFARYYATCLYACVCAQVLVAAAKGQEGCDDGRLAAAPALVPRARRAQRSGRFGSGCGELGSVAESALNEAVLKAHVNEPTDPCQLVWAAMSTLAAGMLNGASALGREGGAHCPELEWAHCN